MAGGAEHPLSDVLYSFLTSEGRWEVAQSGATNVSMTVGGI